MSKQPSMEEIMELSSRIRDLIPDIFDKNAHLVMMSFSDAMDLLNAIDFLLDNQKGEKK